MTLYLFSNDLRTHDQPLLLKALEKGPVLGLYVFDPLWLKDNTYGFKKKSERYFSYLFDTLHVLKENLKAYNIPLYIMKGDIKDILNEVSSYINIQDIYTALQVGSEEEKRRSIIKSLGYTLYTHKYKTYSDKHRLPFDIENTPDVFTHYRHKVEKLFYHTYNVHMLFKQAEIEKIPLKEVTLKDLGITYTSYPFKAGEDEALKHVKQYFYEKRLADTYKETRNDMLAFDASTKFSLYLSLGVISPFHLLNTLIDYENNIHKNESTYWIYFELLWRDYFHLIHQKYQNKIFFKQGIRGFLEIKENPYIIKQFLSAKTGFSIIDSNMKLLNETGYMSNRGRQIVGNFFTKVLKQDFRILASYFESHLLDYDVSSNYVNFLYVSGLGNDPRENRLFNIITQGERYDANKTFVYTMLNELRDVPKDKVYKVHLLSESERVMYKMTNYPKPIVRL